MADIAQLGYEIDSSQARTAASDLDKMTAAAYKAERGAKSLKSASANLLRDDRGRFISTAAAAEKYAAEIDRLRSKYIPLYSASKQLESSQAEIKRALELGAISARQAESALESLKLQYVQTAAASSTVARSSANMTHSITNASFQIQDFAIQVASGQSAMLAFAQQFPQLVGALGFAGKLGLYGALIGTAVAIGSAVIPAFMDFGTTAEDVAQKVDNLTSSVDAYKAANASLQSGVTGLISEFGVQAVEAQRIFDLMARIEQIKFDRQVAETQAAMNDELSGVIGKLNDIDYLTKRIFQNEEDRAASAEVARGIIEDISKEYNLTWAQATRLANALDAVNRAASDTEKAKAMEQLGEALIQAAEEGAKIPPEMLKVGENAINAAQQIIRMIGAMKQAQGLAAGMSYGVTLGKQGVTGNDLLPPTSLNDALGISTGGGGGGVTDPYADNLQRLIESLRTERETVDAWYAENLAILNDRRAAEIIGEQAHKEALLDLEEEYQERKKRLADDYSTFTLTSAGNLFGELYSLSGSGYDGLLQLQKSFGAAQALVNTYTAASQVLADPKLGFFAKFAAVAKTIAAGMGLVNAIKGGGSAGASTASATTATAAPAEPQRTTLVSLQGEDWLVSLVGPILDQVFKESQNGTRVIWDRA